jgi:hypothetical protein
MEVGEVRPRRFVAEKIEFPKPDFLKFTRAGDRSAIESARQCRQGSPRDRSGIVDGPGRNRVIALLPHSLKICVHQLLHCPGQAGITSAADFGNESKFVTELQLTNPHHRVAFEVRKRRVSAMTLDCR